MPSPGAPLAAVLRQADSLAHSASAIASDWKSVVEREDHRDWLDHRDPEHIRHTLPGMKAYSEIYHRGEVRGLENIPAEGPVLLVGNHSGGTLIADTFVFSAAFYEHFGARRRFHQLAHDPALAPPGRGLLRKYGTVAANHQHARRALRAGAAVLVYPGGD